MHLGLTRSYKKHVTIHIIQNSTIVLVSMIQLVSYYVVRIFLTTYVDFIFYSRLLGGELALAGCKPFISSRATSK